MDNADSIMIMTLQQYGCNIDEEIGSFSQFNSDLLTHCVAVCLNIIDPELNIPRSAPADNLKKFKYSSSLVTALQSLGYHGDCGYHHFNYPNPTDSRKFLAFLIEKLPRAERMEQDEIDYDGDVVHQAQDTIRQQYFKPWFLPVFQRPPAHDQIKLHFEHPTLHLSKDAVSEFWDEYDQRNPSHAATGQTQIRNAAAMVARALKQLNFDNLSFGEGGMGFDQTQFHDGPNSRFKHHQKFAVDEADLENKNVTLEAKQEKEKREDIIRRLQEEVDQLNQKLREIEEQTEIETDRNDAFNQHNDSYDSTKQQMTEELKQHEIIHNMLPNIDTSLSELERINRKSEAKIKKFQDELQSAIDPMKLSYYQTIEKGRGQQSEAHRINEALKRVRQDMRDLLEEGRERQQRLQQMKDEYAGMDKTGRREVYIKKIGDMHHNLTAEREQINTIIADLRTLGSDILTYSERLDRIFQEADELIYSAAQKPDPKGADRDGAGAKSVYKGLVKIHTNYGNIFSAYDNTAKVTNQILDVQERIDDQIQLETSKKMKELEHDYDELRKENQTLIKKLKQ
ncbi:putative coiled-coil domain-containing protein 22 [Blattamonas nauphoetae]|uniref:Coiled-coil domain-containing protein 22 n=1 Tax=Blattamonas nauphoetae TaxID=2049346 RepID=A0ABQ9Y1R0_9EUKA|nr:putative coiled-coil domain-containing protein 22 [Blattamonas nauphoetae]